jgi:hypothetical protein
MLREEIEEFAQLLVREVRDRAILSCDSQINSTSNSPVALRWRKNLKDVSSAELAKSIIADCVDDVIFHLLNAIDAGALRLSFTSSNGSVIDLSDEGCGELGGWYMMGNEGWRARYSEKRFHDDQKNIE